MIARRIPYLIVHIADKNRSVMWENTVPQLGVSQKFFCSSLLSCKAIRVTLFVDDKGQNGHIGASLV